MRVFNTDIGALPGRNPGSRVVRPISVEALVDALAIVVGGDCDLEFVLQTVALISVTCILGWTCSMETLVRAEGFEPP